MIIELPREFSKTYRKGYATIRKGILELHGNFGYDFEKIMVDLAYEIKGRTRCYYCHNQVDEEKITIDHLYPRHFGGITVTNNLEPACTNCNSKKTNMNQYEFQVWRTIKEKADKKEFFKECIQRKRSKKCDPKEMKGFDLPKEWVTYVPFNTIQKVTNMDQRGTRRYIRMTRFVKKYKKLPRPMTISANNVLLNGETAYVVAKEFKIENIPVVILENVLWFEK